MWDAIVIGSGISGLAAAAALARVDRRVLVLEQHQVAGGLTQAYRRGPWHFSTGVHYIGGVGPVAGPGGQFGRQLDWLSGGTLAFAACANPYDIVQLPGFEFGIAHPEAAFRQALAERFPHEATAIGRWFDDAAAAREAAFTAVALRSMPAWLAWGLRQWRGDATARWARTTLAQSLAGMTDPRLRAVLAARWGDHGAAPDAAPLLEHALVMGSYHDGAYYPVGGPSRFASTLLPVVRAAGGEVRLGASVDRIMVAGGQATGVDMTVDGLRHVEHAPTVISAMGVTQTVACLPHDVAPAWQHTVQALRPGLSYVSLALGFEGDIAAAGASSANRWIYDSDDVGAVWRDPAAQDAPGLFVSFPSLKDPCSSAPTAEVVALCDAQAFAPWLHAAAGAMPAGYADLKAQVEARLLAQFKRHFPALVPLLRFHELSTPVTQQRYVRSPDGAAYGIEMTAERLLTPALRTHTPVPGLLLAGQDVSSPGVQGAFISGLLAAATVEPTLLAKMAM